MRMATPSRHRRSNGETIAAGSSPPYFAGGCCATANMWRAVNSKTKMLIGRSKKRLAAYGLKLYRALWTPED